jgi:hypothetical protein
MRSKFNGRVGKIVKNIKEKNRVTNSGDTTGEGDDKDVSVAEGTGYERTVDVVISHAGEHF